MFQWNQSLTFIILIKYERHTNIKTARDESNDEGITNEPSKWSMSFFLKLNCFKLLFLACDIQVDFATVFVRQESQHSTFGDSFGVICWITKIFVEKGRVKELGFNRANFVCVVQQSFSELSAPLIFFLLPAYVGWVQKHTTHSIYEGWHFDVTLSFFSLITEGEWFESNRIQGWLGVKGRLAPVTVVMLPWHIPSVMWIEKVYSGRLLVDIGKTVGPNSSIETVKRKEGQRCIYRPWFSCSRFVADCCVLLQLRK